MIDAITRLIRAHLRNSSGRPPRKLSLEPLEFRRLLSAEGWLLPLDAWQQSVGSMQVAHFGPHASDSPVVSDQPLMWQVLQSEPDLVAEGEQNAEGEPADDLVAFAKALAATRTVMYGADWCAVCSQQKQLFEDGGKYLPYVNVTNPDRTPNQFAIQNNITNYPTWVFPDGSRLEGLQSLSTISGRSGVPIAQSSTPYLSVLNNVSVAIGSPLHQPIDAYSPTGVPLTISVTSSNPNLIAASVISSNRSMQISTDFGDMLFQLFEDRVPRPTGRVIELAQSGFYNGISFHRVIDGFMIQGGDPDGNGTGGSPLGNFDDQFHLDLQHNRSGVLSFAKAGDDTNNSQFFITAGPTRHLDFNHSVFGQLVEGAAVRDAINRTATGANDRPTNSIVMREVTIFSDFENAVVFLKPTGTGTGTSTITVTVSDGQGNQTSRTFVATAVADTANSGPFLNDIPILQATSGVPLSYTLTSQDVERDPVQYAFALQGNTAYELDVHPTTGVVTLTAPSEFVGRLEFLVGVRQTTPSSTSDVFDVQRVFVDVSLPPLQISLNAESDSGLSNSDRVTNATSLKFTVTGVRTGALVDILAGSQVIATANASGTTTQITVPNVTSLGEGSVAFSARRNILGQLSTSPTVSVRLDRTAPVPLASGFFAPKIVSDVLLDVNLNHPEEGQGLRYALQNAPTGMTLNFTTGVVRWTPTLSQAGSYAFTIPLTDLAGNTNNQSAVALQVVKPPIANPDSAHTLKNEAVLIPVLNNDTDGGGTINPSSLEIVAPPNSGQAAVESDGQILYSPEAAFVGTITFRYKVSDQMQLVSNEGLVTVRVLNSRWQNPVLAVDVSGDQRVVAFDALLVINYLNSGQPLDLRSASVVTPPFLDVNGDERVTARDALLIINYLNQPTGGGEGEDSLDPEMEWHLIPSLIAPLENTKRVRRRFEFLSEFPLGNE